MRMILRILLMERLLLKKEKLFEFKLSNLIFVAALIYFGVNIFKYVLEEFAFSFSSHFVRNFMEILI